MTFRLFFTLSLKLGLDGVNTRGTDRDMINIAKLKRAIVKNVEPGTVKFGQFIDLIPQVGHFKTKVLPGLCFG